VPRITVLSRTPYTWVDEKRALAESTFVVFRDEAGRIGTIVVPGRKPSDSDVEKAVTERARAARTP